MSLWNALAKHQSAIKPYRLVRMAATPDPDDLRRLCRTRTEELEGFIDGLFGDEEVIDLPERANEALDNLGEINTMMHGILDLMERESAPPASEQEVVSIFRKVRELSRVAEKELHALVLSCKRARQQVLSTIAVDKPGRDAHPAGSEPTARWKRTAQAPGRPFFLLVARGTG